MALRELAELREDAAGLARALAGRRHRLVAGLPLEPGLPELCKAHRLATSRDGLAQVCETLASAEAGEKGKGRIARLSALRSFLARATALGLEPRLHEEQDQLDRRPSVRPPGDAGLHGALPVVQAERELPSIASRDKRGELERALADASAEQAGSRAAAWDAAQTALAELRLGEPAEASARLQEAQWAAPRQGQPCAGLVREACEELLVQTDALAADLGGWLLERLTGARRYPGGAERHDLFHLLWAPRCASAFPRGEQLRTCRRWAEQLRLDLDRGRAIKLEDDERPLQPAGAQAVATDPPYEARISLWPALGPRPLASLLAAIGEAQLSLGPPEDAPPEDLWLGDPGVRAASGDLFAGLVRDPQWLRRCAKADLGRDDERAIAFAAVADARMLAARTLASLEALELGGLSPRVGSAHRELFARATGTELQSGLALQGLDPWLDCWSSLRGLALAARLRDHLRETFDEDWWRNPRSLGVVGALWARGGRPTLRELWAELGADAPSMKPLAAQLLAACS